MSAEEGKHEIVIVRHGGGDHDEGHHGGAWKIAFADFMTAMMCFFLVMWLINASNEQTKAAVASYFNPVKLVDRNSSAKGLEDSGGGSSSGSIEGEPDESQQGRPLTGPADEGDEAKGAMTHEADEERLFSDPYAVLAEIASETGDKQNVSTKGDGGAQDSGPATGASGGEAYRDPFAPDFWSQQVAIPTEAEASAEPAKTENPGESNEAPAAEPTASPSTAEAAATPLAPPRPSEMAAMQPPPEPVTDVPKSRPETDAPSAATISAADKIRSELAEALLPEDKVKDGISVVATGRGVVVSVTDQLEFGMFEIGSALPRREMVLAMQKIGTAIAAQNGKVTIGGFTDARPYRGEGYDNWRLSTARAQSAYYMLVRGGLDESRIVQVAGHADRQPKNSEDPLSAVNRRIEILLEIDG